MYKVHVVWLVRVKKFYIYISSCLFFVFFQKTRILILWFFFKLLKLYKKNVQSVTLLQCSKIYSLNFFFAINFKSINGECFRKLQQERELSAGLSPVQNKIQKMETDIPTFTVSFSKRSLSSTFCFQFFLRHNIFNNKSVVCPLSHKFNIRCIFLVCLNSSH